MATAYIRDIASLEDLRVAIIRFCETCEIQLHEIDFRIESRINNLKSLESQFRREIEIAQEDVRYAGESLTLCETHMYHDEDGYSVYPDCSYEKEELIKCRKRLEIAEANYNTFKREIWVLEVAIAAYQLPKTRFRGFIQFEKEAAPGCLSQLIQGAEDYLSISPMAGIAVNGSTADPQVIEDVRAGNEDIGVCIPNFVFNGAQGNVLQIANKQIREIISTTYSDNGSTHVCSELKIEDRNKTKHGKILAVNIPSMLQHEKIGKYIVSNMEANCRANDCAEIYGWATEENILFYKNLGYGTRNGLAGAGSEVFKPLDSNFLALQHQAQAAFCNLNNTDFLLATDLGKQEINPLYVILPDEIQEEHFWKQHGENQDRYLDLIDKYALCQSELAKGTTLDELRQRDMWIANAYDIFHSSEPIRLQKTGEYYRLDGSGRHRIAAAQIYFLYTGKTINLPADVIKKTCDEFSN
jgi:N-acetylglutamate synthase-like GNAT family acetyltransferase